MDIHKPKAAHSVREFLIEIGTIICGIVIALSGEKLLERLQRDAEVREARAALRAEVSHDLGIAAVSLRQDECEIRYVQKYLAWTVGGARPPMPTLGVAGLSSTVWDVAKGGAVSHMALKEQLAFAGFYSAAADYQTLVERQRTISASLVSFQKLDRVEPRETRPLELQANDLAVLLQAKLQVGRALLEDGRAVGAGPQASPQMGLRVDAFCSEVAASGL